MTLEETCRWSCDGYDQIEFAFGKKCAQIIDKRRLIVVGETRGCKRSLKNIDGLCRLAIQFLPDGSGVLIPRSEIAAEGVQEQDSPRLGERCAGHGEKQHTRTQTYRAYHG